jgi:hypothetical protein
VEFAEAQKRLKQEAADRRREADAKAADRPTDRAQS